MIFVDSNIPMYAAGSSSPQKETCLAFLKKIHEAQIDAASSAEVLQEILHRYRAIQKMMEGIKAYEAFRSLPIRWLEILPEDVDDAKETLLIHPRLPSRDAIHLAVMHRHGIKKIATYDRDFLGIPSITVFLPEQI